MYRQIGEETQGSGWRVVVYRTFRCSHCRALLVLVDSTTTPKECGKCHQR